MIKLIIIQNKKAYFTVDLVHQCEALNGRFR